MTPLTWGVELSVSRNLNWLLLLLQIQNDFILERFYFMFTTIYFNDIITCIDLQVLQTTECSRDVWSE